MQIFLRAELQRELVVDDRRYRLSGGDGIRWLGGGRPRESGLRQQGRQARVLRGASGAPAVPTLLFGLSDHDGTGWDVRAQVSGNTVVVQVHGEAATDITWRAEVQATEARIS